MGETPHLCNTPDREGLPSPKLCLSITPKPAAARGPWGQPVGPLLHGAKHQNEMKVVDGLGRRPCLPSMRQSGTYTAPGRGRARSSTEPRAPNDPGDE